MSRIKLKYDSAGIILSRPINRDRTKGHPAAIGDRVEIKMPDGKKVLVYHKDDYWEVWIEGRLGRETIARCITTCLHDHSNHYDEQTAPTP